MRQPRRHRLAGACIHRRRRCSHLHHLLRDSGPARRQHPAGLCIACWRAWPDPLIRPRRASARARVAQISVSLVLLVGALLFVRSFYNLMTFDPGMREERIIAAFIGFFQSHIPKERYLDFQKQLVDEIRSVPGVLSVAETTNPPLLGGSWTHGVHIGAAQGDSKFTWVGPEYFQTMGIPIVRGRGLNSTDTANSARVTVGERDVCAPVSRRRRSIGVALRTNSEPDYASTVYSDINLSPRTRDIATAEALRRRCVVLTNSKRRRAVCGV